MVHTTTESTHRTSSSSSTATYSSLRSSKEPRFSTECEPSQTSSNGTMESAAAFSRSRRSGMLKNSASQPSMRSMASTSTADSAAKKGRGSPQPRSSLGTYVDRAREVARHGGSSSAAKRGAGYTAAHHQKARRRSAQTVMQSGRHGNEWLFNGWSLRETVKGLLK